jgi:hypothetical protein
MEKIIAWLNSDREYFTGLALLHQYSKNRQLLFTLTRKANPEKLEYELRKLAPKDAIIHQPAPPPPVVVPEPSDRLKIVRNDKTIHLEELPERLQRIYTETVEIYKLQRALHERAKLIQDDKLRAPVVQKLVEYDSHVRENWAVIDSWNGLPDPPAIPIDHRRINANRKFITDNRIKLDQMPAGKEREELIAKMQQRINELRQAGESLPKIKDDLTSQGFQL